MTLGIIIGNRDFFPDSLVEKARTEIIEVFAKLNMHKTGSWVIKKTN